MKKIIDLFKRSRELRSQENTIKMIANSNDYEFLERIQDTLDSATSVKEAVDLGTRGSTNVLLRCAAGRIWDNEMYAHPGNQKDWHAEIKDRYPDLKIPCLETINRYRKLYEHEYKVVVGVRKGEVTNITTAFRWIGRYVKMGKRR